MDVQLEQWVAGAASFKFTTREKNMFMKLVVIELIFKNLQISYKVGL